MTDQLVPDDVGALTPFVRQVQEGRTAIHTNLISASVSALLLPEILDHVVQYRGRRRLPRLFKETEKALYDALLQAGESTNVRSFFTDLILAVRALGADYDARLAKATGEAFDDSGEQDG